MNATDAVLMHLPAAGLARSQLAAATLGDAHGLDGGRPVTTLVMAILRRDEERARDTWARVGVLVNELAAPALVLNLPVAADTPFARLIAEDREAGLPLHLTLRGLMRTPPRWRLEGRDVFACENPNIVAIAADRLGAACAPLVCTEGMPSASQRTLLAQLAAQGARLHYHGDFDWPGIHIANYVVRTFGAKPWRMNAIDYLGHTGRPLGGAAVDASWDEGLRQAMETHGYVLEEESVVDALCDDLRASSGLAEIRDIP